MSLPRYAEYKDSGVAWLGEVPMHWVPAKVKSFTRFCGGGTPSRDNFAFWNGDIPWVSPKDMKSERIRGAEESITEIGLATSSSSLIEAGNLLMVVRSGILKHTIPVAINDVPVALNQDMKALHFNDESATSEFFLRWVQGLNDALLLAWAKQGATVESIEHDYLAETVIPLPPLEEQFSITAFLARETGKIDALIAEQEKLLTLLAEKRQASISHTVTRGLNPNAPLKDSGVPWLGEVPAHWEVKSLKHVIAGSKAGPFGSAITKDMYVSEGYRVYGQEQVIPADFSKGDYFINEGKYLELQQYKVVPGDVLISCVGTFGKIAIVPEGVHPGVINPRLIRLRVADDVSADFLVAVLRSAVVFEQFSLLSRGGTMDVINMGTLSGIELAVPPYEEQLAIVHFIVHEAAKLDALNDEVERAILLLKERRSALIAAAVTGKIDVRRVA